MFKNIFKSLLGALGVLAFMDLIARSGGTVMGAAFVVFGWLAWPFVTAKSLFVDIAAGLSVQDWARSRFWLFRANWLRRKALHHAEWMEASRTPAMTMTADDLTDLLGIDPAAQLPLTQAMFAAVVEGRIPGGSGDKAMTLPLLMDNALHLNVVLQHRFGLSRPYVSLREAILQQIIGGSHKDAERIIAGGLAGKNAFSSGATLDDLRPSGVNEG